MNFLTWVISKTSNKIKRYKLEKTWGKLNKHNNTRVGRFNFEPSLVQVGFGTYGTLNVLSYGNESERLIIGNFCSIATDTIFILSGEHNYRHVSTFPFKKLYISGENESESKGKIVIGNDVWIGYGVTILSGVTIGQGAIIAAGSVVAKNIPPYSIFIGGQVKKYRFSQQIIQKLMGIDFDNLVKHMHSDSTIKALYTDIDEKSVDLVVESINLVEKDCSLNNKEKGTKEK